MNMVRNSLTQVKKSDHPPFPDISSLWQATAEKGPQLPTLNRELQYDVAIIGGGYTGMSTVRYLAAKGLSPVILEASRIGWGASGRKTAVLWKANTASRFPMAPTVSGWRRLCVCTTLRMKLLITLQS